MANTTFQIKRTSVPGRVPTSSDIDVGELAINLTDRVIFSKDGSNTVFQLLGGGGGGGASSLNDLTDVVISSPVINQILQYNGTFWVNDTFSESLEIDGGFADTIYFTGDLNIDGGSA